MIEKNNRKSIILLGAFALFSAFLSDQSIQIEKELNLKDWYVINDAVMGGKSKGQRLYTDSSLVFFGDISFANNGGFSALKSPFRNYDLSKSKHLVIRYKSANRAMAFSLETEKQFYRPYYKYILEPTYGQWQSKKIALLDFDEYSLNEKTGAKLKKTQLSSIIRLGLINTEKIEGAFTIEIGSLEFE